MMPRQLTCPFCEYHPIDMPLTEAEKAELAKLRRAVVYREIDQPVLVVGEVDTSGEDWVKVKCPNCDKTFHFNKRTGRRAK